MEEKKEDKKVEMVVRLVLENTKHTFTFKTNSTESFVAASKDAIDIIKEDPQELRVLADKIIFALNDFIRFGLMKKTIQDYRNRVVQSG